MSCRPPVCTSPPLTTAKSVSSQPVRESGTSPAADFWQTAGVSWLVETSHAQVIRESSRLPRGSTVLVITASTHPAYPGTTLAAPVQCTGPHRHPRQAAWALPLATGRLVSTWGFACRASTMGLTPHVRRGSAPRLPRLRLASTASANGQRQLAGGDVPRTSDPRVQRLATRFDGVAHHHRGLVVLCGSPGVGIGHLPRAAWDDGGSAVLQVGGRWLGLCRWPWAVWYRRGGLPVALPPWG